MNINKDDLVAVICEGKVEKTIINRLLDSNSLIFDRDNLLNGEILNGPFRSPGKFIDRYLTHDFDGNVKITILLISDKMSPFKIPKPYDRKVKSIEYILTKPEIEMLMIHGLNLYDEFNKHKHKKDRKPSDFLKNKLNRNVKSEKYVNEFYNQYNLLECIKIYNQKCPKNKNWKSLYDILNLESIKSIS